MTRLWFFSLADNGTYPGLRSNDQRARDEGDKGTPTDAGTTSHYSRSGRPRRKVDQDLIDFTDIAPTLAEITGEKLPAGVTIDGRSFAPQLRGQRPAARMDFRRYHDPRWLNFRFSRYAQDKQ